MSRQLIVSTEDTPITDHRIVAKEYSIPANDLYEWIEIPFKYHLVQEWPLFSPATDNEGRVIWWGVSKEGFMFLCETFLPDNQDVKSKFITAFTEAEKI